MMTSWQGNTFRITGRMSDEIIAGFPSKRPEIWHSDVSIVYWEKNLSYWKNIWRKPGEIHTIAKHNLDQRLVFPYT